MLILLPPSEGKTAPRSGAPVDVGALGRPDLNTPGLAEARGQVLDALVTLCADPDPSKAITALGLSAGQQGEIARNAALRTAPAAPAGRVYSGVLYGALELATIDTPARRWLNRSVLVSSGLWGVVRLTDRVPAYRCPIGGVLPGVGPLARFWRGALTPVLTDLAGGELVLDLRSGAYAPMWTPPAARTVSIRVLHERLVDGVPVRTVVSHFNKATKGRLVRDLAVAGARPRTPAALATALRDLGYELTEPAGRTPGSAGPWDVTVAEI